MNEINIVKRLYSGFSNRDKEILSTICVPNIKWVQNPGFPGGTISIGIDQIISNVYEGNKKRYQDFSFIADSFESNQKTVLVQGHYKVKTLKILEPKLIQTAHIFTLKEGKVIQFNQYTDTKQFWDIL